MTPRPPSIERLERRALLTAVAVTAPLPAVTTAPGAPAATVDLSADFTGADVPANTVFFTTSQGLIPVQLTPGTTPLTVANFLSYATAGKYDNSFVHRSVPGFIWQGGGYTYTTSSGGTPTVNAITAGAPVQNEYAPAHPNVRGTIAMAKVGTDPNSATDQWFFNEADNSSNLDNQNGGFTTFGDVVGNGLAVVDAIAAVPTYNQGSPFDQLPLVNYTAGAAIAASNLVTVNSVRPVAAYAVASSNPAVVTAAVDGSSLTYAPVAAGTADVTVTATGVDGSTASQTFAVTVADPTVGLLPKVVASTVPTAVVAGRPVKGTLGLILTNTTAAVDKGTNLVQVYAVPAGSADATAGTLLATAKAKANLPPRGIQRLAVAIRKLPTTSGAYTLLVRATNAAGTAVTAATGPTVTVAVPAPFLSATVAGPTTAVAGKPVTFTVIVGNSGNVDSTGTLTVALGLNPGGTTAPVSIPPVARGVRVKAGGKPLVLRLKVKLPTTARAGTYQLTATVTQGRVGASAVGAAPLIVS